MFVIKVSNTVEEFKQLVDTCLSNRMYVAGWDLNPLLNDFKENPNIYFNHRQAKILVGFVDDKPVSLFVYKGLRSTVDNCMSFTKKAYRKQGYNSLLIDKFKTEFSNLHLKKNFFGIKKSKEYFRKREIYG